MSEVTSPLALDKTLQQVAAKLGAISFSEVTGQTGKSAYASAQDGGFTGTEAEFNSEIAKMPTVIRPNLIINPYFIGGGSQKGGGQLPINQKGQTSYSGNAAKTIDGWILRGAPTLSIGSDGISIGTDSLFHGVIASAENGVAMLAGKTVTISALISAVTGSGEATIALSNGGASNAVGTTLDSVSFSAAGLYSKTFTVPSSLSNAYINFCITAANNNSLGFTIQAAKLELGSTQTLAHNEGTDANPVWVLNEIPNYTEELWRCQRYYQLFASSSYRPTYGEDYRPPMRLHSPTKGTISIGGTTYYYADANL